MDDPYVYLNGTLTPLSEAKIPVLDRGFIFGDGIYEVIPVYGHTLFRPAQHLARLFRGLAAVGIANPYDERQWLNLIEEVVRRSRPKTSWPIYKSRAASPDAPMPSRIPSRRRLYSS